MKQCNKCYNKGVIEMVVNNKTILLFCNCSEGRLKRTEYIRIQEEELNKYKQEEKQRC